MQEDRLLKFSLKFFLVAGIIAIFLIASSFLHTFTSGKIQQGLVPTP